MADELWIWVHRWEDFQHYKPDRDHAPAWIKSYTRQLDDDRYLSLTLVQRGLLESLRIAFARAHGRLPRDTRKLTRRIGERVTSASLASLNDAGFISFLSREDLEQRLEKFYASRARARGREKLEREEEVEEEQRSLDLETEQAGRPELHDVAAAGLPAESEAEDEDPEPELRAGPMAESVRAELLHLRPRGATA